MIAMLLEGSLPFSLIEAGSCSGLQCVANTRGEGKCSMDLGGRMSRILPSARWLDTSDVFRRSIVTISQTQ